MTKLILMFILVMSFALPVSAQWAEKPNATTPASQPVVGQTMFIDVQGFEPSSPPTIQNYVKRYLSGEYPGKFEFTTIRQKANHVMVVRLQPESWKLVGQKAIIVQPQAKLDRALGWASIGARIGAAITGYRNWDVSWKLDRIGYEAENARYTLGTMQTYRMVQLNQAVGIELTVDDFEPIVDNDVFKLFYDGWSDDIPVGIEDPLLKDHKYLPEESLGANVYVACMSLRHRLDSFGF